MEHLLLTPTTKQSKINPLRFWKLTAVIQEIAFLYVRVAYEDLQLKS